MRWLRVPPLTISAKVTFVFVLLAGALIAGLSVPSYRSASAALQAATLSQVASAADEKKAALENWVEERKIDLASLAASPDLLGLVAQLTGPEAATAPDRVAADLRWRVAANPHILALSVMDPDTGQVIASSDPSAVGKVGESLPVLVKGRTGPYIQAGYLPPGGDKLVASAGTPLRATDGALLAVLGVTLDMSELTTIVQRRTGRQTTDDAFLINSAALFVTQPRLSPGVVVLKQGPQSLAVTNVLAGKEGAQTWTDYRKMTVLGAYRWIPELQLALIIKVDQIEAEAPVRDVRKAFLIAGVAAFLAACVVAFWLVGLVTLPLRRLAKDAHDIGEGNLDLRPSVRSRDEIGRLAEALASMATNLKTTMASRDELEREIEGRKRMARKVSSALVELQRSNLDLEQFAYVASHDLQEPLRMVASYTQLLSERYQGQLDDKAQTYIHYAVDGASRMQRLVNDLLAFSRVSTQGRPAEPVDSQASLKEALLDLAASIEESRAIVTNDDMPIVRADSTQLPMLFQNLIGNAIKFRGEASPCVHVSARKNDGEWLFSVEDNGIGIEPQYADRVFEIFQRLHSRDEYPGTGIGLALCKRIVERHGGKLWFESIPGKGSTFYFTLPI